MPHQISLRQISALPEEILEKILLDAAILNASPTSDNNADVYRQLAAVCRLWKKVVGGDEFCDEFLRRLKSACK